MVSEMGTQDVCEAWATDVVPITQTFPTSSVNEQKQEHTPQSMDSLDMMVLSSFPYPIATTYKSFYMNQTRDYDVNFWSTLSRILSRCGHCR